MAAPIGTANTHIGTIPIDYAPSVVTFFMGSSDDSSLIRVYVDSNGKIYARSATNQTSVRFSASYPVIK